MRSNVQIGFFRDGIGKINSERIRPILCIYGKYVFIIKHKEGVDIMGKDEVNTNKLQKMQK